MGRRQFLRGLGGALLAIPALPSLLPAVARADASAPKKRMVAFTTNHGGVWQEHMYPHDITLVHEETPYAGGHPIRWGPLTPRLEGSTTTLSPVLSAASGKLTSAITDRMFIVRGCDVPFYLAHHTGGYLGNYARNDGNGAEARGLEMRPTIDQVMAWSPSFYGDMAGVKQRSLHIGRSGTTGISWGYANPQAGAGAVQNMPTAASSRALFDDIFVSNLAPPRAPVVDVVMEQYRRLTRGAFGPARRLSSSDRGRLEDYMARLAELERKLAVTVASCGDLAPPTDDATIFESGFGGWVDDQVNEDSLTCDLAAMARFYALFNDVIVAAFMCDTSRIATVHGTETFALSCNYNAWHQNVAHVANGDAVKQDKLWRANQWFFEHVWLDLVTKLQAVPTEHGTMLDESLVWWTQESGVLTHEADSLPIVAAGGAGGFFRTGQYYDYRNAESMALITGWVEQRADLQRRPGLLWNQWLATVLQSMNVAPSEFERGGVRGYGVLNNQRPEAYPSFCEAHASDVLPRIRG